MSKFGDAKAILCALNVSPKQQNNMCCCVLLAMANVHEDMPWEEATNTWIRIHDVIAFSSNYYNIIYAENSRETIRKQAMHHFRNAAFIEDNGKATNSPNYRYRLTDEMLALIQSYGTAKWKHNLVAFQKAHSSLVELYASKRTMRKMPVQVKEKISPFLLASIMNCRRLLSRNLHPALRQTLNACMLAIPLKRIWSKTWTSSVVWALKSHSTTKCQM